ncbi:hypothetical protein DID75_05035 [Candidatus Marinamargulisbacteria bacterium SCGC AG-410-N11]|nr:hypothetical protein DID75_05035 [Candidatus Marinamargulisbacteria bacterium SCGC AG-410-N11]
MAKKKSNKKSSSNKGYGKWNVARRNNSEKDLKKITKKKWPLINSYDLYTLFQYGYKTESLAKTFKVKTSQILNKLRTF